VQEVPRYSKQQVCSWFEILAKWEAIAVNLYKEYRSDLPKSVILAGKTVEKAYKNIKISLNFLAGYWQLTLTAAQLRTLIL